MGFGAAKDQVLKFQAPGDAGTVLTDISAYFTSLTGPEEDAQNAEVSTLGDAYKEYIRTQVDPGSISGEGIYDPFMGTFLHAQGTAVPMNFEWYPQGSASGKQKWSGSALLASGPGGGGGIDDAVTFSAEWKITGTTTIATL